MHRPPVDEAGMFWIVRHHTLFKSGHAGIVDNDISDRNTLGEPKPVSFVAHIQLFEAATDLPCRRNASSIIQIGDDDIATFIVKARSDRTANAMRSTSDNAGLTVQFLHSLLDLADAVVSLSLAWWQLKSSR